MKWKSQSLGIKEGKLLYYLQVVIFLFKNDWTFEQLKLFACILEIRQITRISFVFFLHIQSSSIVYLGPDHV